VTIFFTPSGSLDIASDASDLPEQSDGNNIQSGAMTRCKNLRTNQAGKVITRDGSAAINAVAIDTPIWWIEELGGTRYSFAGTKIYSDESSIATGLTSAQWAAIEYNPFNDPTPNVFALNGTDRKRIEDGAVYEWGIDAPTTAPTVRSGQGAGLTGEYNAKYTYVRKVGAVVVAESNPSPAATTSAVLSNASLAITATAPTDPQVTHLRFYRTTAGAGTYLYDGELAVNGTYAFGYTYTTWEVLEDTGTGYKFTTVDPTHNTENTYSWEERYLDLASSVTTPTYTQPFDMFDSTVIDGDLGDEVATDHDRPPLGSFVFGPAYDGTCFILKDNLLYYCKPKQPEYWPATFFIEVSTPQLPLKTGFFHNGQVYVCSSAELYYIQGTGDGTFLPFIMRAKVGAQSLRGAASVAGRGIYRTGPDGIYLFTSGADSKISEQALDPIFRGEDTNGMPGVATMAGSWIHVERNQLYFGYRSSDDDYPAHLLVLNLETNRVTYYTYDDGAGESVQMSAIATDQENQRLLVGDSEGFVRVIENTAYTDDSGTAIDWEAQSKDYVLQTRRHFPRWVKYDVDASNADSCIGELLLRGEVHHSHTITGSRDTRRRLVREGNGERAAHRLRGSGPVTIYAVESE
jgi:hypothetical protein